MWPFSPKPPEPVIRRFSPGHAHASAEIHARSFHQGWPPADIARLAAESSVFAHVALDPQEKTVWGFSLARHAAQEAEILTIAVAPGQRGHGVGRLLLSAQLSALASMGIVEVFLEVDAANAAALALYKGLGFSKVGERKAYYARPGEPPAAALILRRALL